MKKISSALFLGLSLFLFSTLSHAQVGITFPTLTGETLDDKAITLPDNVKGKFTIIGMAHSTDAEQDLQSWMDPIYQKYIAKTGLLDAAEDVNVFFIPMFSGSSLPFYDKAKKKMTATTQEDLRSHVIFYKGEISSYKEKLIIEKKDTPYIFVLNKDGKVVYATNGTWTEAKMDAMDEKIE
jgi:hypothetical protein